MKKVLIITYYWPPAGGPGVQRILKLVKYLPQFGWEPLLFVPDNPDYPVKDASLENEIPEDIKVYRSQILEPYGFYKKLLGIKKTASFDSGVLFSGKKKGWKNRLASLIRANLFIPDAKMGWLFSSRKALKDLLASESIDLIFSTSPPFTPAVIAGKLAGRTGIPWMMDMRDPWEGYGTEGKAYVFSRWINRRMAKRAFQRAASISLAWPGIRDITEAGIPGASLSHSHFIPNGFDYVPRWDKMPSVPDEGVRFTITYAGSFYARRYPDTFIRNLGEALRMKPELADHLRLQIIGRIDPSVTERMEACLPPSMLKISTYMPHQELMRVLEKTDALWIVMDDVKESMHIVAGKTYEYLGMGKPILACVPPGSQSAMVIESTHTGVVVDQDNPLAIAQLLHEWLQKWQDGKPIVQAKKEMVNEYHRKSIAGKFAAHFDQLLKENERI